MIDLNSFKSLIGQKVSRFFVIIWPPFGEEKMLDVDMSIGFEFEGHRGSVFQIKINIEDNWTPLVTKVDLGEVFKWPLFDQRVSDWMKGDIDKEMSYEYYDATQEQMFNFISSSEIFDIEFLTLKGDFSPFAVKIIFRDDCITVSANSDGSTIETSLFNTLGNLDNYRQMGVVECLKLKAAELRV